MQLTINLPSISQEKQIEIPDSLFAQYKELSSGTHGFYLFPDTGVRLVFRLYYYEGSPFAMIEPEFTTENKGLKKFLDYLPDSRKLWDDNLCNDFVKKLDQYKKFQIKVTAFITKLGKVSDQQGITIDQLEKALVENGK